MKKPSSIFKGRNGLTGMNKRRKGKRKPVSWEKNNLRAKKVNQGNRKEKSWESRSLSGRAIW